MSINKNTLGIIDMKIVKTREFFRDFHEQTLTIWTMDGGLYAIEGFVGEVFVKKKAIFTEPAIVLKGVHDGNTFAIECHRGFGIAPYRSDKSYWIDKVNSEDAAVIVYKRNDEV